VADPVKVVLVSAANAGPTKPSAAQNKPSSGQGKTGSPDAPSVIRVRGGDLKYSDAERKAVMHGGALGSVLAETGDATTRSSEVELVLLPPGNHAGKDGGSAQVDRMTALGNVIIDSQGRHGPGERLDYSSERGEYVLTGTGAAPPRMTDPARGTVTGGSLIFNSRDDSVNVEGDGRATTTETTVPKRQ
jgi:lipopolysaccharide export system protein LptA